MTTRHRSALATALVAIGVATPRLAAACAVCLGGTGGATSRSIAVGSLFLTAIPLVALGATVWYVWRRAKAIEREERARRIPANDVAG